MIRIVSGELRGRRLAVGPGVRPTTERAREALFSMLGEGVRGARVLDAAAGSGALGFEALSRGAREVVFVEADKRVAKLLVVNASTVGMSERVHVVAREVAVYLRVDRPAGFDIVFFDPPWASPVDVELAGLWSALEVGGTFVVERGSGGEAWPDAPVVPEVRNYGTTTLFLYRKTASANADAHAAEESTPAVIDPPETWK